MNIYRKEIIHVKLYSGICSRWYVFLHDCNISKTIHFNNTSCTKNIKKKGWRSVQSAYPFRVEAICLLPDHLHCIVTLPDNDSNFSKRIQMIKGLFSIQYLKSGGEEGKRNSSRKKKGEAAVWQRRFWEHMIRDEKDMQRHFDYIHYNPVKHALVKSVSYWEWSTFHRFVRLGFYHENWGCTEIEDGGYEFGE